MCKSETKRATKEKNKKPKTRANWGANESPRQCKRPTCRSTNLRVLNTRKFKYPDRVVRYRVCRECGQTLATTDFGNH